MASEAKKSKPEPTKNPNKELANMFIGKHSIFNSYLRAFNTILT